MEASLPVFETSKGKRMKQALYRAGIASVAVAMLATSSLAFAQPNNHRGQSDDRQQERRVQQERHVQPGRHVQQRPSHGPSNARPGNRPQMAPSYRPGEPPRGPRMHSERGAGPEHNWYRGGRMPPQYRTNHYVVNDWRGHHLSPPPRGYYWVQNGPDYLLVAIATGVIFQIILRQ